MTADAPGPGLAVLTAGSDAGRPVLCLHGLLGRGTDWLPFVEPSLGVYRFLLPDLPGHGQSVRLGDPDRYRFEAAVRAVLAALDRSGLCRARLVGYSLGGRLALYLALRHPDRFSRVVLISGSPGLRTPEERAARIAHDEAQARDMVRRDPESFLREWYRQPVFVSLGRRPDLVERWIKERREQPMAEPAAALSGLSTGRQPNLWPDLPALQVPALFLAGAADPKFADLAVRMGEMTPGIGRHAILPDCGHVPHAEAPAVTRRLVTEFLHED